MKSWFALLIRRRFLVLMIALAAAAGGVANLEGLAIVAVPDISPKQVMILTLSPELGPLEVERLVTFPVETAMAGAPGLSNVRSTSRAGARRSTSPSTSPCRSQRRGPRSFSACHRPKA